MARRTSYLDPDHIRDRLVSLIRIPSVTGQEDAAIADAALEAGQTVSLSLSAGLLHAAPGDHGGATGVTTTDAASGAVVGVTGFEGIIDLDPGHVSVVQVPAVRAGGDESGTDIAGTCEGVPIVTAAGVEAVSALRNAGVEPTTYFAPGEVAADAAARGLDAVVVATQDTIGRVTDALTDASVSYDVAK